MKKNLPQLVLGEIAKVSTGGTPNRANSAYWTGGTIPWLTTSSVDFCTILEAKEFINEKGLKNSSAKIFPIGTLLMAMYGQGITRGKVAILGFPSAFNQACAAITPDNKKCDSNYLYYHLEFYYHSIRELGHGGNQKNLNTTLIKSIPIFLPSLKIQKEIASVLRTWDGAIENVQSLIFKKKEFLAWIRQNICTNKQRLNGYDNKWKKIQAKSVLFEHKKRSSGKEVVHSVSVHKGIIDQVEHLGRSFAAENKEKYNLVHYGDIIYTKSPTGDFPWGIIKQSHKSEDVIVSPLYGVFTPTSFDIGVILDFLFESYKYTSNYLNPLVQKGAKNTISITNFRFLDGYFYLPSDNAEIKEIANLIKSCRDEILILEFKLEKLKKQKRGLMQKLLTGAWPVTASSKEAA